MYHLMQGLSWNCCPYPYLIQKTSIRWTSSSLCGIPDVRTIGDSLSGSVAKASLEGWNQDKFKKDRLSRNHWYVQSRLAGLSVTQDRLIWKPIIAIFTNHNLTGCQVDQPLGRVGSGALRLINLMMVWEEKMPATFVVLRCNPSSWPSIISLRCHWLSHPAYHRTQDVGLP